MTSGICLQKEKHATYYSTSHKTSRDGSEMFSTKREVVVVGGGVAGCACAIHLSQNDWKVTLVEKNTLLSGTSGMTPARMSLGFHYIDFETSVLLLKESIRFVKAFPGYRIGENFRWSHPLRHGRYFITKDSLFPSSKIIFVYESLKNEYKNLVKNDPSNMVFGDPNDFYRVLDPNEYENDVNMHEVSLAIETPEHFLNWKSFAESMIKHIDENESITVKEHCELIDVIRGNNKDILDKGQSNRFTLVYKSSNVNKYINTNYVVNSTWYEIERLNSLAGFNHMVARTNRLKVLLEVELPECMLNTHSMFFCFGPFCTLSNHGNRKALMTYAPVSNIEISTDTAMSRDMDRLLKEGPNEAEFKDYSKKILNGAIKFIPKLKDAVIKNLKFGIVQTRGHVNIYDPESSFHERAYFGVKEEDNGWISNPCMKLMYLLKNGEITTDLIERHYQKDTETCN